MFGGSRLGSSRFGNRQNTVAGDFVRLSGYLPWGNWLEMRFCLHSLFLAIILLLTLPLFADESTGKSFMLWSGSASAQSCVTSECHPVMGSAKYVHPPVADGECLACHIQGEKSHPGPNSMKLVEDEPGLCLQCHENPTEGMAYPHSAVEEGCTGCHSPHQGSLPNYVLQEGGKLCLACHDDVIQG
jgi:predicted CXXCH cytochrome family protein